MSDSYAVSCAAFSHIAGRIIDTVADIAVLKVVAQFGNCHDSAVLFTLLSGCSKMRDQEDTFVSCSRCIREVAYITADLSFVKCLEHCLFVHQTVSCKVEDNCVLLHHGDRLRIDHPLGGIQQRYMNSDVITLSVDRLNIRDMLYLTVQVPCPVDGDKRIVSIDFHSQSDGSVGNHVADGSKTDHAEFLS